MNKFYLLTFNDDYGDEHNVPALACFDQATFDQWLNSSLGTPNPNYETQHQNYTAYQQARNLLNEKIKSVLGDKWGSVQFQNWPAELLTEYNSLPQQFGYDKSYINPPQKLSNCNLSAWLGNGGDCFEENYMNYSNCQELISNKHVTVTEVEESFYTTFHKVNLDSLSLCNIFELNRLVFYSGS